MFRYASCQARNIIQICRISEILGKTLPLSSRCYHRSGIYDDDDGSSFNDKQDYDEDYRPKNSNNRGFRRNRQFSDRNTFENRSRSSFSNQYSNQRTFGDQNQRSFPNQFSRTPNRGFGQQLVQANFDVDNLPPFEKYLYAEHPDVAERSEEEVAEYRKNFNMSIKGSDIPKPITDFNELCLPDNLKNVVLEQDYTKPTPIQSQGWPIALSGRDMVGISQTGSGKTLVFMLPAIIHALNQPHFKTKSRECKPQVLVLAPTRELVQQILHVGSKFCDACELISACAYGGASRNVQLNFLKGAHICIATPGRLIDFISEREVSLENCTYLVLDEADRMLDMGFEPQIRNIVSQIRPDRQTLMWSATWPKDIQNLAEDFLQDYIKVTIGDGQLVANPKIEQNIYMVEERDKEDKLVSLLEEIAATEQNKVLVFAQTKRIVDYIGMNLNRMGIKSMVIHGDVSQTKRDFVLKNFRKQKSCVLIATDVAARGLDITDVQHIINYDFPLNIEDYIHRIGRTARGDSSGKAHSFFTPDNSGLASELITVLKQAKQSINPELYNLVKNNSHRYTGKPSRPHYKQRYQYALS